MPYKVVNGSLGNFIRDDETNEDLTLEEACAILNSTESVLGQLTEELDKINNDLYIMNLYNS